MIASVETDVFALDLAPAAKLGRDSLFLSPGLKIPAKKLLKLRLRESCVIPTKTKYEHYLSIRRESREYAREQARKHCEILAQVEVELNLPKSLRRYATKAMHEE